MRSQRAHAGAAQGRRPYAADGLIGRRWLGSGYSVTGPNPENASIPLDPESLRRLARHSRLQGAYWY